MAYAWWRLRPAYTDIGWPADSHIREAEKRLPLRRFARPEEIAKGIAFLASDGAAYMTGCTLTMDGGATLPVVAANDFVWIVSAGIWLSSINRFELCQKGMSAKTGSCPFTMCFDKARATDTKGE